MSELITCKDLTKRFGNHTALDHLNLSLDSGKIIGLLGPNGAGKTTTFYMIVGLIKPNERKDDALKAAERTADPE